MRIISISLKNKTEILITIDQKSSKERYNRTPETTHSLLMNINGQQSSFTSDVDYKIENINKKKELINRMLQNLKDLSTTTSMSDGTKRNYTPLAISEFGLQTFEVKKRTETPNIESDFKSKVRKQTQAVNILQ